LLGEAFAEVFVFRVRTHVPERQDRDGRGQRRGTLRSGGFQKDGRFRLLLAGSRPGQSALAQASGGQGEVAGGREPPGGSLFRATQNQAVQLGGTFPPRFTERRSRLVQNRGHRVGSRLAEEGTAARNHFIHNAAEGEDIAAGVGRLAAHLFGRHVRHRSQQ